LDEKILSRITIKPTLACNGGCEYCDLRRELFSSKKNYSLPLEKWEEILSESKKLGAKKVSISGGEPLLYPQLPQLVKFAKKKGFFVNINSNGSLFTSQKATQLSEAKLDSVTISLPSKNKKTLDKIKKISGLYKKIMDSINHLKKNKIKVYLQTIISKDNYFELDQILKLALDKKLDGIAISYPEADFKDKYILLNNQQINSFNKKIKPKCLIILKKSSLKNKEEIITKFKTIYAWKDFNLENASNGIYWSPARECKIPYEFNLILQNGDVLPCNAIEYFHEPIIGNVQTKSIKEINFGTAKQQFLTKKTPLCKYCPMNLNFKISFSH